jgi:hypothetical protein
MKPNAQMNRTKQARVRSDLEGVHGWLRFFVIVMIYIWPLTAVVSSIGLWITRCVRFAPDYPLVIIYYSVCIAGTLYLALMSNEVGHRLQNKSPGAVRSAKKWILLVLVWSFVWLVLSPVCGGATNTVAQEAVIDVGSTLIGFAIWYSYFTTSQRVRATYPDAADK